jgi:hypothetical protein
MKPEEYLIKDYNIEYDENYLIVEDDLKDWFDNRDYFDCGQGYYQDETVRYAMTQDGKFWKVALSAEILSAKQDVGDRLYWVDEVFINSVEEISKPKPKDKSEYTFNLMLTDNQKKLIDNFIKDLTGD